VSFISVLILILNYNNYFYFREKEMSRGSRTLYVGNLPGDIRVREVEDLFYKVLYSFTFLRLIFI